MAKERDATQRNTRAFKLRRAFWLLPPLVLAGVVWMVHQLQKPVYVKFGPQDIESRMLFERMRKEAREHPYASQITLSWSQPWPKESGLNLSFSEGLELNRRKGTLDYHNEKYGWIYSNVKNSGLDVLADARLKKAPITLSRSIDAQLRSRGWTLTEHYLP